MAQHFIRRIPFRQQLLRHLGHDRRVAGNAVRIERWRRDAAMAPPRLALAGQKPAAECGLKNAPSNLRLRVVRRVVQQDMANGFRLVEDEHTARQNANNVGAEILWRVGGPRIVTHGAERLPQVGAALSLGRAGVHRDRAAIDGAHRWSRSTNWFHQLNS
jgi:hypothetical protein